MSSRKIIFPQSPMVDLQTGYLALEWFMWFQNPQFLSIVLGTPIDVVNGGTGLTSGTSGGILGFTGSTTLASSVALTQHAIVIGGGAGATPTPLGSLGTTTTVLHGDASGDPTFGSVSLTADVTGVLVETNGGTHQSTYTLGDILYSSSANTLSKLAGNTTSTKKFLRQTGTGAVSAAPAWDTVTAGDITGTLGAANGGTGFSSYAVGDLLYADTTTTLAKLPDVAVGSVLISGGVGVAPSWGAVPPSGAANYYSAVHG